jgi:CheY-like chemotaxis protein
VIVTVKLAPFLQPIKADAIQIDQVLLNLIVNSRDAMPDGGQVTIETSLLEVFDDEHRSNGIEFSPGHYVRLCVSDTGCGMSEEVRARIFEPFFTTKAVGKGTGLGLSVVHGIVKQSGGQIRVHSLPGVGTTFEILFPAEVDRNVMPEASDGDGNGFRGSETILLVEDETAVRQIARQVLESHGYCVLEASHGGNALEVAARHLQPVDMLVTDMVMPEMGGRQLVEIMRSLQPGIRVLFMSGYTDDTTILNRGDANADTLIYKPFSPKALVKKVRDILDQVD